jgi:hypothetical protein
LICTEEGVSGWVHANHFSPVRQRGTLACFLAGNQQIMHFSIAKGVFIK